ncbi:MAG TPA: RluA family pseudouridine synthase [Clostridiaceae bacterium]|jgi:23S rRNA pseudouridine1911/1915/1917 synthase|nr:RluA family pseudouridine synthase [Clostridiaceae bacterium]
MKNVDNPIKIIYEDNHLLVVEKPPNMPVQRDISNDEDMLGILKEDIKARYNKPGNVFLGLVHRLDRPVGGVMVFARTSKAASRLSDQIRRRIFGKEYFAVVRGSIRVPKGEYRHYLLKDTASNIVSVADSNTPNAKEAVLDYEVLDYKDGLSLVRVNLHTGRPHQIRVQFATEGNPLFGDQKYGASLNKKGQQIALWSYKIRLKHPTKNDAMEFTSNPPAAFPWNLFAALKL